jgi:hypothetical protein
MKQMLPAIVIISVLFYALYLSNQPKKTKSPISKMEKTVNLKYTEHVEAHKEHHWEEELNRLKTNEYTKEYVISVINHGSRQFDFRGGEMEGGFASPTDASKIACYVLELSGKKCKQAYEKDAPMFYSSNCAGCHGEDGKGLNGTYPDLTREKLLGVEKKEVFLKNLIAKMK